MIETKPQKDISQSVDGLKDRIKDKIEKLTAAMYLVTNFLADLDEIKWKLRHQSLGIKVRVGSSNVLPIEAILSDIKEIVSLIDIAVLDTRASAMNFSILRQGYLNLQTEFQSYLGGDWYKNMILPSFEEAKLPIGSFASPKISPKSPTVSQKRPANNNRREKIIGFIKQHSWSSIRDIAKFIPDVGSKTIQRELAELIRSKALQKTGERRWSRYNLTSS